MSKKLIFHLIPNAHLDPVWLWDWREGLNEGLTTVRTILDLMEEFPALTFIRGESVIYEHIQKTDSTMFKRLRARVEEGRWDVVGGTVIQPDTNLASTEVLCRQYERGLAYFEKHLGVRPKIAWQADSFGHTPGLPNILSAFGMEGLAFTRPQQAEFPLESAAFWWEGDWKNRILCYRQHWPWYCSTRDNVIEALDRTLIDAEKENRAHVGVLFGMGNHGGGPTRRHLREVEQWSEQHPEVEVVFDTLHGFFAKLSKEIAANLGLPIPTIRGEFGYCLRGCYSSAQKFKSLYRHGEVEVVNAEITRSLVGAATQITGPSLEEAWDALLFNAFHDILPGSSIERAMEEQTQWMGLALHHSRKARFAALNQLAAKVDTSVPAARHPDRPKDVPILVWNFLPRPFKGLVEVEAGLDYRPIDAFRHRANELPLVVFDHEGNPKAFQEIATEHNTAPEVPWRKRVLVPLELPAFGWTVVQMGWRDSQQSLAIRKICSSTPAQSITNGDWQVEIAEGQVNISRQGKNFLARNLQLQVLEDSYGSWGGLYEEKDSYLLDQVREVWEMTDYAILESGPLRAKLWTRWAGKNSWIDLTFAVAADSNELQVEGRLLWNERSARLKLVLPCSGETKYEMPGGKVTRNAEGHVPGGRWVLRSSEEGTLVGFASDVLSDFDATPDELRVTLARATRYASDVVSSPTEKLWEPAMDCGELKFRFSLFGEESSPNQAVDSLLVPPATLLVPPTAGPWPRQGSLGSISPDSIKVLSIQEMPPGQLKIRLQNLGDKPAQAVLQFAGAQLVFGDLAPGQIKTFGVAKLNHGDDGESLREAPRLETIA